MPSSTEVALNKVDQAIDNIIKTRNWELPESSLDGWRPFTATLTPDLLEGPSVRPGYGLTLTKDVMAYACGARGSCKSVTISYLLAKEMRMGKPVWTNYPISFYVAERGYLTGQESDIYMQLGPCHWVNVEGTVSYYESMPLDMEKFYRFHQDLRKGAVGITELQYFVEARTSIREQNRLAGYQIMQIRKTANSFLYDVQNPRWVDNRFGWSADFEIKCADISKMRYDAGAIGRYLEEGEFSRRWLKDISGLLTGIPFSDNEKIIGPYQFAAWNFWFIYPTHFIVDAYDAMHSLKKDQEKNDRESLMVDAINLALLDFINNDQYKILNEELFKAIQSKTTVELNNVVLGKVLSSLGVYKKPDGYGHYYYFLDKLKEEESSEAQPIIS
jgi:hypothetical protein